MTTQFIENQVCPAGLQQVILRDGLLKGFGLRITDKGYRAYVVEHRVNGAMTRVALAKYGAITLDDARDKARIVLKEMAAGHHPNAKDPVITLGCTKLEVLISYPVFLLARFAFVTRKHFSMQ